MREVRIKLSVIDNFSRQLENFERGIAKSQAATDRAARAADRAAAKSGATATSYNAAGDAAGRSAMQISKMSLAMDGVAAAFTVAGFARVVADVYKVGLETRIASEAFDKLSGTVGSASGVMRELQKSTGGVVDDLTLMHGANRFLSMGIATTEAEVGRLTQAALVLGRVMGYSGQEAIESFSLLLSNESVLRLDNFGLSAAKIRREMALLAEQNSELTRSDRFRIAVLDEIENKFGLLGDAVDAVVTPVKRLEASFSSLTQSVSATVSSVLDQAAGALVSIVDSMNAISTFNTNQSNIDTARGLQAGNMASMYVSENGEAYGSERTVAGIMQEGLRLADAGRFQGAGSSAAAAREYLYNSGYITITGEDVNRIVDIWRYAVVQRSETARIAEQQRQERIQRAAANAMIGEAYTTQRAGEWIPWTMGLDSYEIDRMQRGGGYQHADSLDLRAYTLMSPANRQMNSFNRYYQEAAFGQGSLGSWGGKPLMDEHDIANMQTYADELMKLVDHASELSENLLIRPEVLTSIEAYSANVNRALQDARDTADAFANATFGEILGEGGGGRLVEMDQQLLAAFGASGASQDQQDAFARMLNMDNGSITAMGEQWRSTGIPMIIDITEELGFEAGLAARTALLAGMDRAAAAGYTGTLPYDLLVGEAGLNVTSGAIDYGGGSGEGSYVVRPGDTLWDIAQARGMTVDSVRAAAQLQPGSWLQAGQTIDFGGAGASWMWDQSQMGNATEVQTETDRQAQVAADSYQYHLENAFEASVNAFTALLNQAAAHVVQVPIEFVIQNGGAMNTLLAGAIAAVVNGNGGTTPGSSGNSGRSNNGSGSRGTSGGGRFTVTS